MSHHSLCAWHGYAAVSCPPPPSHPSAPIPTWQVVAPLNSVAAIAIWGTATNSSPVANTTVDRLKQFCTAQAPEPISLRYSPPFWRPPLHHRFPLQPLLCVGIGILLGLGSPRLTNFNLSQTLCTAVSPPAPPTSRSVTAPEVSLNASLFGTGGIANAQIPQVALRTVPQSTQFIQPVPGFPLTSGFGNRIHPISGDVRFHQGVDFGTPTGTPVKAAKQGVVTFAGWDNGYGNTVILQHTAEYETLYAHLDEVWVSAGDRVAQGKVIGLSGSTGYATGPHLHFEIRSQQVAQNPIDYLGSRE